MSNDYLEFKEHLEHAFTQKDKAEYYKNQGSAKVYNKASSVNKDEVRKKMLAFISQFNGNEQAIKNMWKTNTDPGTAINQIDKGAWKHSKGAASRVMSNELKKRYDQRHDVIRNMLTYAKSVSGTTSGVFTSDELSTINKLANAFNNNVIAEGTARNLMAKLQADLTKKSSAGIPSNVKHDDLEHGWFTDLFKKKPTYTSTGSAAGMPTNLPKTATSGGSAGSKQLVYSDQLRKLNSNLIEYELKMNQAKASYEEYRKLYNDTKKTIANTEKALSEATKEAARTGFDPSKSSVAAPARRYASSNAILPQTTITGSTEGLKKSRYNVKKKK